MFACRRRCCICHKFCANNMEIHHIVPKKFGGNNEYSNLLYLDKYAHKLVHTNREEAVELYLKHFKSIIGINSSFIDNINRLRLMAGNKELNPITVSNNYYN